MAFPRAPKDPWLFISALFTKTLELRQLDLQNNRFKQAFDAPPFSGPSLPGWTGAAWIGLDRLRELADRWGS